MSYREFKDFEYAPMKLNDDEIENPRQVIADFFQYCSLKMYRKYISSVLKSAYAESYWCKDDPATLLRLHEHIERLIEAVFVLDSNPKNLKFNQSLLVDSYAAETASIEPSLYAHANNNSTNWDFFPRYLSKKEFINPYRVFAKFFKYKNLPEWREQLNEVIYYSLISDGTKTAGVEIDYLQTFLLLQKLVEAAHLVTVREIKNAKDNLRDRVR